MLTLSRVSLHTAAFIAGAFATFLVISRIDNAFVVPQAPQAPASGVLGGLERGHAPIPAQGSQKAPRGAYSDGSGIGP